MKPLSLRHDQEAIAARINIISQTIGSSIRSPLSCCQSGFRDVNAFLKHYFYFHGHSHVCPQLGCLFTSSPSRVDDHFGRHCENPTGVRTCGFCLVLCSDGLRLKRHRRCLFHSVTQTLISKSGVYFLSILANKSPAPNHSTMEELNIAALKNELQRLAGQHDGPKRRLDEFELDEREQDTKKARIQPNQTQQIHRHSSSEVDHAQDLQNAQQTLSWAPQNYPDCHWSNVSVFSKVTRMRKLIYCIGQST